MALSPEARGRLIEGTGGNPLALLELSVDAHRRAARRREPLFEPLPVSARVERAFLQRVRTLPEAAQTLLLVAAADERAQRRRCSRAAAQLGAGIEALDAAEQAGLLRVDGARLSSATR